jgi:hypothetical protein
MIGKDATMAGKRSSKPPKSAASKVPSDHWQLGTRVKIRYFFPTLVGRIVELRGPLGPGGIQIYGVRYRRKPKPVYIEMREDQLIPVTDEE